MIDSTPRPYRIGAVRYLNSKPLVEGLADRLPKVDVVFDYPSRLADALAADELDVALVPSVACLLNEDYTIVSDACVATRGEVMSVKLYCRVPPGEIRRLALDEGSRTSAALVRIILAERCGVEPELEPLPMRHTIDQSDADAVLLIGDRAMHPPADEEFTAVWDLGREWYDWTGLPFVFAMWAARGEVAPELEEALCRARDDGVSRLLEIADREAPGLGLSSDVARHYLTRNLHFRLGSPERTALKLFRDLALQNGLLPGGVELVFRDCTTAGTSG